MKLDWKSISLMNNSRHTISMDKNIEIHSRCGQIAEARFNEYYERNRFTSIKKVKRDFMVGQFCEQGAYEILLPFAKMCGVNLSEPDFDFHENNIHGYDLMFGNVPVSVKGIDSDYNGERSWIYQPDKLLLNEGLHALMHCHNSTFEYSIDHPPTIEWCYYLSRETVVSLLKEPFKYMGGKKAIYEKDIVEKGIK